MTHVKSTPVGALLLLAGPTGLVAAQGLLYSWPSEYQATHVFVAGDVDGDGIEDWALGYPIGDSQGRGRLHVHSGADGRLLLAVPGLAPWDRFGSSGVALADLNDDGRTELAVSAPGADPAYLCALDGASGAVLWTTTGPDLERNLGSSVERLDDLDGDGIPELAATALGSFPESRARVFVISGASGSVLYSLREFDAQLSEFGGTLERTGDHDGDGLDDLLVSDRWGANGYGQVTLHSGRDGEVIRRYLGPFRYSAFGATLASLGDLDGDEIPDFAVGSPDETIVPWVTWGRVRVLSGATGEVLLTLEGGGDLTDYGDGLHAHRDLDGDGLTDLALSAGFHHSGCCAYWRADLRVVSSTSGATLYSGPRQSTPVFDLVPDVNGDGREEFLVPVALAVPGLAPPSLEFMWETCPPQETSQGCDARLDFQGAPSPTQGHPLWLRAENVPGNTLGLIAWSGMDASQPLGGGTLCLAAPIRRSPMLAASADGAPCPPGVDPTGSFAWRFPDQELLALGLEPGETFYAQAWFRDPGAPAPDDFGLTNGIDFVVWP